LFFFCQTINSHFIKIFVDGTQGLQHTYTYKKKINELNLVKVKKKHTINYVKKT